jgi:hypothetical protein
MRGDTVNHTSDTTAAGNGGTFGPEQAAALLDQDHSAGTPQVSALTSRKAGSRWMNSTRDLIPR